MLSFIGFIIIWVVSCLVLGMLFNIWRANQGNSINLNDGISAFIQGFTFGPIGVMAAFHTKQAI